MVRVVFVQVGVITDAFNKQGAYGRKVCYRAVEGGTFHINSNRSTNRNLHLLEGIITPHRATRGHRRNIARGGWWIPEWEFVTTEAKLKDFGFIAKHPLLRQIGI